jgi:hypothetical protein
MEGSIVNLPDIIAIKKKYKVCINNTYWYIFIYIIFNPKKKNISGIFIHWWGS